MAPLAPRPRSAAAPPGWRRPVIALIAAGALAVPAACGGSQLDPAAVRAANEAVSGQIGGTTASTGGTGTTGDTTGSGPGGDTTGGGADGSTGSGSTGSSTGSTGSTGSSTGSTGSSTGSAGSTGSTGSTGAGDAAPPAAGVPKGSCDGFKNQTGITDDTVRIANASDISGPVPGLFTAAQQATKAYAAYFNATSDLCGRKLEVVSYDSRTDAAADQQAYQKACAETFAGVGSVSAFDSGGAKTAQDCGLPDVRGISTTRERLACTTCFATQASNADEFENAVPDFFVKNYHEASQKAAFLYLNAGAAAQNAKAQIAVEKKRGMKFLYTAGIDVAEFNYGPFVQAMKDKGVEWVQFLGAYQNAVRLAQAMQQADFKPTIYLGDPTIYNSDFVKSGGSAVEGAVAFISFTPFEEAGGNREMQLYQRWLQQVAPGAEPTFFGLFAWSAAKLFVEHAVKLGGKLTRQSLVRSLGTVHKWTADGLHAEQDVAAKHPSPCWRFIQVKAGKWVPLGGTKYLCTGYSRA